MLSGRGSSAIAPSASSRRRAPASCSRALTTTPWIGAAECAHTRSGADAYDNTPWWPAAGRWAALQWWSGCEEWRWPMKAKSGGGLSGGSRTTQPVNPGGLSQYGTAQGGRLKGAGSFTGINSAKAVFEGSKTNADGEMRSLLQLLQVQADRGRSIGPARRPQRRRCRWRRADAIRSRSLVPSRRIAVLWWSGGDDRTNNDDSRVDARGSRAGPQAGLREDVAGLAATEKRDGRGDAGLAAAGHSQR